MAKRLASTIFKNGAKDKLLTVDPYKIADTVSRNNIVSKLGGLAGGLTSKLGGFGSKLGKLADIKGKISAVKSKIDAVKNSAALKSIKSGIETVKKGVNTARKAVGIAKGMVNEAKKLKNNLTDIKKNLASDVKSNLSSATKSYLRENAGFLGDRLASSVSEKGFNFSNLKDSVKQDALGNTNLLKNNLKVISKDALGDIQISRFKDKDGREFIDSAKGIKALTGGSDDSIKVIDLEAEQAVATATGKDMVATGMSNQLKDMLANIEPESRKEVVLGIFPEAAAVCDLTAIWYMLSVVPGKVICARYPDACEMIMRNYRKPIPCTPEQEQTECATLRDVLGLMQENWWYADRNGTAVIDITAFSEASGDALTVFRWDDRFETAIMLAPLLPPVSIKDQVLEYYPFAPEFG
ncbi:hypothetical protein Xoosp14_170 [Xanthomonas phage Xoo-sp14]|nr:hypothetical protein Xoosp14_170 [Xanthomonas phage Xoo-sp14]